MPGASLTQNPKIPSICPIYDTIVELSNTLVGTCVTLADPQSMTSLRAPICSGHHPIPQSQRQCADRITTTRTCNCRSARLSGIILDRFIAAVAGDFELLFRKCKVVIWNLESHILVSCNPFHSWWYWHWMRGWGRKKHSEWSSCSAKKSNLPSTTNKRCAYE